MFSSRTGLPIAMQEIYPSVVGDGIILAGGVVIAQPCGRVATDRCFIYDRIADCWLAGPSLPEPLHHPYLIGVRNTILAIGGFNASSHKEPLAWTMRSCVLELPSTNKQAWTRGPTLPEPRAEFSAGVIEGRVVIAGGRIPYSGNNGRYVDHDDTRSTLLLAEDGRSWLSRAGMPTARNSAAAAVLGRRLHVIGGRRIVNRDTGKSLNLCSHEAYDIDSDKWIVLNDIPQGVAGAAAVTWEGCIYVFGGERWVPQEEAYASIWKYDPLSKQGWSYEGSMPDTRHGLGAIALADGIHLLGGATGPDTRGTCKSHIVFRPQDQ